MTLQLGAYSFGNTPRNADGSLGNTPQAIRDVLEAIRLTEKPGLDFLQVDIGGVPQKDIPSSIELLCTEVAPQVWAALA
jgi:hypothetical protein